MHWPVGGTDLGVGGVSYVELLILYELWAGERLTLEKAHPRYLRPGRPISVSFGPGINIRRSCRFIVAMMRSLCLLPGGLVGLCIALLVLITADFVILVGRGVSWAYFSASSSRALLDGTFPLRYCSTRFARGVLTWSLPMPGHVAGLVCAGVFSAGDGEGEEVQLGLGRKRIRLNRANPSKPRWILIQCILDHVFGRGCIVLGILVFQVLIVIAISMTRESVLFIVG